MGKVVEASLLVILVGASACHRPDDSADAVAFEEIRGLLVIETCTFGSRTDQISVDGNTSSISIGPDATHARRSDLKPERIVPLSKLLRGPEFEAFMAEQEPRANSEANLCTLSVSRGNGRLMRHWHVSSGLSPSSKEFTKKFGAALEELRTLAGASPSSE